MKTLLLWDIDGTLTSSIGAGIRALTIALRNVFGIEGSLAEIKFAGRTDAWAVQQVFQKFSIGMTQENLARYFDGYIAELPAALVDAQARVLPGVREVLHAATAHGQIAQGLLTGNMRRGAQVKLAHHGLWEHFPFGAFGDDSPQRNNLGPFAVRRARDHHGHEFAADRVWIIGDTPHDIECGQIIGARTLGVATGAYSVEQLSAAQPTAVLADLNDTNRVLELFAP